MPRGEDRGFDDRVLGAVEAEEFAEDAAVDDAGDDAGALVGVIERLDLEGVPAARVGENDAGDTLAAGIEAGQGMQLPTAARASSSTSSVT